VFIGISDYFSSVFSPVTLCLRGLICFFQHPASLAFVAKVLSGHPKICTAPKLLDQNVIANSRLRFELSEKAPVFKLSASV
jgi:hypothetical protein